MLRVPSSRRVCRVFVSLDFLGRDPILFPQGSQVVNVEIENSLVRETGLWFFIENANLPEVANGDMIPERGLILTRRDAYVASFASFAT